MRLLPVTLAFALVALAAVPPAARATDDDVTIYRCAAADGSITLRDSPCLEGETQKVRNMTRPKDPPPPAADPQAQQQPQPVYYYPAPANYDGVSSSGSSRPVRRWAPATAPAPQTGTWGQGSWSKGSWTDSGSWTDR